MFLLNNLSNTKKYKIGQTFCFANLIQHKGSLSMFCIVPGAFIRRNMVRSFLQTLIRTGDNHSLMKFTRLFFFFFNHFVLILFLSLNPWLSDSESSDTSDIASPSTPTKIPLPREVISTEIPVELLKEESKCASL